MEFVVSFPGEVKGHSYKRSRNKNAQFVNNFARKLCTKSSRLKYIDLWTELAPNNVPNKINYDLNDPTGMHISASGADAIKDIFLDFTNRNLEGEEYQTPRVRKRLRSSGSTTPGSATSKHQNKKQSK